MSSASDAHDYYEYCNPDLVKEAAALYHVEDIYNTQSSPQTKQLLQLMDFVDGTAPGKIIWIGICYVDGGYVYRPDRALVESNQVLLLARLVFREVFSTAHGIVFGTDLRRLPGINGARWAILLRWSRNNRLKYTFASPSF